MNAVNPILIQRFWLWLWGHELDTIPRTSTELCQPCQVSSLQLWPIFCTPKTKLSLPLPKKPLSPPPQGKLLLNEMHKGKIIPASQARSSGSLVTVGASLCGCVTSPFMASESEIHR